MPRAFLIFHLNLAYSSISEKGRSEVIRRCYWPVLALAKSARVPLGIELTGWTLRQIAALDPAWIGEFRVLVTSGRCELVGSGYAQIIGPLVPYEVNAWNQQLGLLDYREIVGACPELALVNEMAYSSGLADVYREAGYRGFVMDRDNVRLAMGIEHEPVAATPTHAIGASGQTIPVLWSDSILFQKLQHYAHGDISMDGYLTYLRTRIAGGEALLPLYCNDAEIFDYRPGRFREERPMHGDGEWNRLARLLSHLAQAVGIQWCTPSQALAQAERTEPRQEAVLSTVAQPVPVKKQAKYNLARWAVTGRNDLWLNTMCHRLYRSLRYQGGPVSEPDRRALCELWASDLRTHITEERWREACDDLAAFATARGVSLAYEAMRQTAGPAVHQASGAFAVRQDDENILLSVRTSTVHLVVNLRRGLTIHTLAFRTHAFAPTVGTLPHGYFSSIALGADYYSGGVIVELPGEHSRVTDLERVEPDIIESDGRLSLCASIVTRRGPIVKTVTVDSDHEQVTLEYWFPGWKRKHSIVRAGIVTLLPEAFGGPLAIECVNGGEHAERFTLDCVCDHSASSSSLVSCTTGFGATDGTLVIGDTWRRIAVMWDPAESAAFPMLLHKPAGRQNLTRLLFSLGELDDTSRPEGEMPGFALRLAPHKIIG